MATSLVDNGNSTRITGITKFNKINAILINIFPYFTHAGSNLKHVDSSIVLFSTSTNMTRYDKADLMSFKDRKESQQPPSCYYDPNIIRLNILKFKNQHTDEMEEQMKIFREKLQNLSFTGWDPNIRSLLRDYHYALLNPFQNGECCRFRLLVK